MNQWSLSNAPSDFSRSQEVRIQYPWEHQPLNVDNGAPSPLSLQHVHGVQEEDSKGDQSEHSETSEVSSGSSSLKELSLLAQGIEVIHDDSEDIEGISEDREDMTEISELSETEDIEDFTFSKIKMLREPRPPSLVYGQKVGFSFEELQHLRSVYNEHSPSTIGSTGEKDRIPVRPSLSLYIDKERLSPRSPRGSKQFYDGVSILIEKQKFKLERGREKPAKEADMKKEEVKKKRPYGDKVEQHNEQPQEHIELITDALFQHSDTVDLSRRPYLEETNTKKMRKHQRMSLSDSSILKCYARDKEKDAMNEDSGHEQEIKIKRIEADVEYRIGQRSRAHRDNGTEVIEAEEEDEPTDTESDSEEKKRKERGKAS